MLDLVQVLLSAQGALFAHAHGRKAFLHERIVIMFVKPHLHLVLDGQASLTLRPAIKREQGHDGIDYHEREDKHRDDRTPLERNDIDKLHDAG